jgi:hypothetical protein
VDSPSSKDLKTQDLLEALEPIVPTPGTALDRIAKLFDEVASLLPDVDLQQISDSDLLRDDTTARVRRTYVLTLNRLYQFMRNNFDETVITDKITGENHLIQMPNVKAQIEQAKVALGYVRHLESMNLAALQLGRNPKDEELKRQVAEMRGQMADLAAARSRVRDDLASLPGEADGDGKR